MHHDAIHFLARGRPLHQASYYRHEGRPRADASGILVLPYWDNLFISTCVASRSDHQFPFSSYSHSQRGPMRGSTSTVLLAILWSLLLLPLVSAYGQGYPLGRRTGLHGRLDDSNSTSSASASPTASSVSSSSSTTSQSSSSSQSSSFTSQSSTTSSSASSSSPSTRSTTTTSSSSTSVLTTTSSHSSSSSASSSSSSFVSSVSSTSKTTAALAATPPPITTFTQTSTVNANLATSDSGDQPTTSAAKSNINAASTGFWGNKGAVGGTFTVVALVVVGILAGLTIVLRRRASNRNSARDTFYDTKGPVDRSEPHHSPGPSMASLGNEPMDAHATPMPNYGAADQYLVDTGDYNYPPGASYATHNVAPEQYYSTGDQEYQQNQNTADQAYAGDTTAYFAEANAYESSNQHYSSGAAESGNGANGGYSVSAANHRPSLSPHPYSHPTHLRAPPSAMRDFAGRDSYQPSIDSFYGAAGTAV